MAGKDYVRLDVLEVNRISEKAILLVLRGGEEVWIPRSQIHPQHLRDDNKTLFEDVPSSLIKAGDRDVYVSVSAWIVREKELRL